MQDKIPDSITEMWESTNAEVRISHELLTWVGRSWDVDPMVFVNRKGTPGPRQNLNGTYFKQLAEQAERLLLKPARAWNGLKGQRLRQGLPYLYPQVEMTVADVEKWLTKYECQPSRADNCHDFSYAFMGDAVRIVCMVRDDFGKGSGFATYRKGNFAGYLEDTSKLGPYDYVPVLGFGKLLVSSRLANRSRIEGTDEMLVILTLIDTIPEPLLGSALGEIGYRIGRQAEVHGLTFPQNFKGAVGLSNFGYPEHPYVFIAPDGTLGDPHTLEHDFEAGTLVYAVKEENISATGAEKP